VNGVSDSAISMRWEYVREVLLECAASMNTRFAVVCSRATVP